MMASLLAATAHDASHHEVLHDEAAVRDRESDSSPATWKSFQ